MSVDRAIYDYTRAHLPPSTDSVHFEIQFEIIVTDIVALLRHAPDDARHTAVWLVYFVSTHYMHRSNEASQQQYAQILESVFRRLYNDRRFIDHINAVHPRHSYPVLLCFYHLHHALIMNGLRAPSGPLILDHGDALRMLQFAVGAAHGPWHSRIRLRGGIRDYYHASVRDDGQDALIELGRLPLTGRHPVSVATWNMQGSSETAETKWRSFVLQLARSNAVVALQEAGVMPSSSLLAAQLPVPDQFGTTLRVDHYLWNAGTMSRPEQYHIFYLDVQRLRVNLALVVSEASGLDIVQAVVISDGLPDDQNAPVYRPALGLQLRRLTTSQENMTVYCFHAISSGGPNAPRMLREISWHTPSRFIVLGDFNRDPRNVSAQTPSGQGNWISPPDIAQLALPAAETHPSTAPQNMLDYAIVDGTPAEPGQVSAAGPSDHRAVSFQVSFPD
ncbi:endonuclease/exonuclease/phosphatase family protein [Pseudomonas sp. NPDC089547]|uniref:endonuclease/exonuclease/phosphatase family protein n=1 Tax=Pseudomonas sp. NPDC089547 TaxID=3390652 RepID=UPI003CFF6A7E